MIGTGFPITGFTSVATQIVSMFDTHPLTVNMCMLIFYFMYVPMNLVVVKSIEKLGLRWTVSLLQA
jgi:hypothetical protein